MEALHHSTARQLREALGEGRIGAEELVRAYRRRIEKHDGRLNTVAELDPSIPPPAACPSRIISRRRTPRSSRISAGTGRSSSARPI